MLLIAFALAALLSGAQAVLSVTKAQYIFAGINSINPVSPFLYLGRNVKTSTAFSGSPRNLVNSTGQFPWADAALSSVDVKSADVCANVLSGLVEESAITWVDGDAPAVYYTSIKFDYETQTAMARSTTKIYPPSSGAWSGGEPVGVRCVDGFIIVSDRKYGIFSSTQLNPSFIRLNSTSNVEIPLGTEVAGAAFRPADFAVKSGSGITNAGLFLRVETLGGSDMGVAYATISRAGVSATYNRAAFDGANNNIDTSRIVTTAEDEFAIDTGSKTMWTSSGNALKKGTWTTDGSAVNLAGIGSASSSVSGLTFSNDRVYAIVGNSVQSFASSVASSVAPTTELQASSLGTGFDVFYTASAASFAPQAFALAFFSALAAFFRRAL